jgi:hypothetical protein
MGILAQLVLESDSNSGDRDSKSFEFILSGSMQSCTPTNPLFTLA